MNFEVVGQEVEHAKIKVVGVGGGGGLVCNSNSAIVIAIKSASSGASVGQSSPSALTILWSPSFPTATILYIGGVSSRGTDSK